MNSISELLGIVAGAIALLAFIPFVRAILHKDPTKRAKPNIITWSIWVVVNTLLIKSYYDSGARNTLWLPSCFLVGDVVICILSFRFGEKKKMTITEIICIAISAINILGIIFYSYDKTIVLALAVIALVVGGIPTIEKSWKRPLGENKTVWSMFALSAILNCFSIEDWSRLEIIAHPLYVVCVDLTVAAILWIKTGTTFKPSEI